MISHLGKRVVAAGQGIDALQDARTIPDHLERIDLVFALEGTRRRGLYLALLVHRQRAIRRQFAAVDRFIDRITRRSVSRTHRVRRNRCQWCRAVGRAENSHKIG